MSKRIIFERIKNPSIVGYSIYIKENGKLKKIGHIDNPNKENPISVTFKPTDKDIISTTKLAVAYRIGHANVMAEVEDGVRVTVNDKEIDKSVVAFNNQKQTIVVYVEVKREDVVTVSYHIDGVEYIYDGEEEHEFVVRALFNEFDMTVGKHYQLI